MQTLKKKIEENKLMAKLSQTIVNQCSKAIMRNLSCRKGFDFDNIDEDILDEIQEEIEDSILIAINQSKERGE